MEDPVLLQDQTWAVQLTMVPITLKHPVLGVLCHCDPYWAKGIWVVPKDTAIS